MKLSIIVNNFGEKYDGVGNYAQVLLDNLPQTVEKRIYTSNCYTQSSKIARIINMGMTKKVFQLSNDLKSHNEDVILIEYPFTEFNPLILLAINRLGIIAKKKNIPIIVSLHEFDRLNPLAKFIANFLCKKADSVMVTTSLMQKSIMKYNNNTYIRKIPSNIYDKNEVHKSVIVNRNKYVFFGTINKMKAIPELLNAWKVYNHNEKKVLYILTATKIDENDMKIPGVKYICGAEDIDIIKIMKECAFCFVPIRPYVDEKNSTFFTGCLTGCISIGCMCKQYRKLQFVQHILDYESETFLKVLHETDKYSDEFIQSRCNMAYQFGCNYSPEGVANSVYRFLDNVINNEI